MKDIKELENAYFRMDDALDFLAAKLPAIYTDYLSDAWAAHKLLDVALDNIDPKRKEFLLDTSNVD